MSGRPRRRRRRRRSGASPNQAEKAAGGLELAPPRLERGGGERILAPLLGLPLFIQGGRRPCLRKVDGAFVERRGDEQRARDGDQRRERGEGERVARGDGPAQLIERRFRLR